MKRACWSSLMLFLVLSSGWAARVPRHGIEVAVWVYNVAAVPPAVLNAAERQSASVLDRAGVQVTWHDPRLDPPQEMAGTFIVSIGAHAKHSASDMFGIAFQSADGRGRYCDLFYDRMVQLRDETGASLPVILGSVLAHELGHLLLGLNSHSATGIMRAAWGPEELHSAAMGRMGFTASQVRTIQERYRALEAPLVTLARKSTEGRPAP